MMISLGIPEVSGMRSIFSSSSPVMQAAAAYARAAEQPDVTSAASTSSMSEIRSPTASISSLRFT